MSWSSGIRQDVRSGIREGIRSRIPRRALLLALLLGLAACGFSPVYGPSGDGGRLRHAVRATEPDTDISFALVRQIEARLGLPSATRYDLTYDIATDEVGLAIDGSNNVERFNIEGRLDWALIPVGTETPILTGREEAFTAYSATGSTISTLASERDARQRLAVILADRVVARLLASAPRIP